MAQSEIVPRKSIHPSVLLSERLLRYIKGVGPKKEAGFRAIGVHNQRDLLYYLPFRYEDRSNTRKIKDLKAEEFCLVQAKVKLRNLKKMPYFLRKKMRDIFSAVIEDDTGMIECVWFNRGFLYDYINTGDSIIVYGKPTISNKGRLQFNSPEYELAEDISKSLNVGRIVGIYRLPPIFTQKFMRSTINLILTQSRNDLIDPIPFNIRNQLGLANIVKSVEQIHFPSSLPEAEMARQRFIFEELFISQVLVYLRKAKHRLQRGVDLVLDKTVAGKLRNNLEFTLTQPQALAIEQMIADLAKPFPMHRLLQGDVGCGKTIVAAFPAGLCAAAGWQTAIMVPTEILAYQHQETFADLFKPLGFTVAVLTSSLTKEKTRKIYAELKQGKIDIIIGTHALIQEDVQFAKLGLVIIDEQHKFGVAQRTLLPQKGRPNPHVLVMSATPIPRTLALSLYGDLDLSIIKQLPAGRLMPENMLKTENDRPQIYDFLRTKLNEGRQAYVIYPVIEESQDEDLKSLEIMFKKLVSEFNGYSVKMFHGKMKNEEKIEAIHDFKTKKTDILVCTTVVEVGVNIENASLMIVENPERFGLAQLHQLRGRIRRSTYQPYFILISPDKLSQIARQRLEVIAKTNDGFVIAEEDLKLRGPGDFFGASQHGFPGLKLADPLKDLQILEQARGWAYKVIKDDPFLEKQANKCLREHLKYWFSA
jgi:ATP-dependent DNA helicase RecG